MACIHKKNNVQQWLILVFVLMLIGLDISFDNVEASYAIDKHFTVQVEPGDTVWGIAAKNVSNKDDIRKLVLAIKQLNGLDNSVQIYPGQQLKIPFKNDPFVNSKKYATQANVDIR